MRMTATTSAAHIYVDGGLCCWLGVKTLNGREVSGDGRDGAQHDLGQMDWSRGQRDCDVLSRAGFPREKYRKKSPAPPPPPHLGCRSGSTGVHNEKQCTAVSLAVRLVEHLTRLQQSSSISYIQRNIGGPAPRRTKWRANHWNSFSGSIPHSVCCSPEPLGRGKLSLSRRW